MAAPASKTIHDLNGSWAVNDNLSESSADILKVQGVNWLTRKVIAMANVTLTIDQRKDENGEILFDIDNKPSGGLPATQEKRVLNWKPVELTHGLFGNIRGRSRICKLADLDDDYLRQGWEDGTEEVMQFKTEHLDSKGVVTQQVGGFIVLNGTRHYARRVLVNKEDGERLEAKLVYDYQG
ncbi:Calycin [Penicillium expansum]|uniref:Calycin n=1 Tax=Penicillium expansum TaxID=27334 RepID=A0A0A2J6A2_PENEN|nr:Calycin [Penicillium expansum]KGO41359.1 Calycin [Penicillium expansum]KGO50183.1 Calycin [Penicillium expansum]KGO71286.1 Calycin [Penicillium expansum]